MNYKVWVVTFNECVEQGLSVERAREVANKAANKATIEIDHVAEPLKTIINGFINGDIDNG